MSVHFWNFVHTAWEMLRNALSTSNLSLTVFSLCIPLAVFLVAVIVKWYEARSLVQALKASVKPVLIGAGVTILAWGCLFSWALYKSVYNDHQNLIKRLRAVVNEKDELKRGLGNRDLYIQQLKHDVEYWKAHPVVQTRQKIGAPSSPQTGASQPSGRVITRGDREHIVPILRSHPASVEVEGDMSSAESLRFAQDVLDVSRLSGWQAPSDTVGQFLPEEHFSGALLLMFAEKDTHGTEVTVNPGTPEWCIVEVLRHYGPVSVHKGPTEQRDKIVVHIGLMPER